MGIKVTDEASSTDDLPGSWHDLVYILRSKGGEVVGVRIGKSPIVALDWLWFNDGGTVEVWVEGGSKCTAVLNTATRRQFPCRRIEWRVEGCGVEVRPVFFQDVPHVLRLAFAHRLVAGLWQASLDVLEPGGRLFSGVIYLPDSSLPVIRVEATSENDLELARSLVELEAENITNPLP